MFTILMAHCNNNDCPIETFSYASCEPPICPKCETCAECGHEGWEHEYSSCPTEDDMD